MKKIIKILSFVAIFTLLFWFFQNKQKSVEVNSHDIQSSEHSHDGGVSESDEASNKEEALENKTSEQNYFDHYLNSLPTSADFQQLSFEEVHHSPEIVKNGGELLGRIHEEAEEDASKKNRRTELFKLCAEDKEIATSIRAVCLSKVYKLMPAWEIPVALDSDKISKEVEELAIRLP